MGICFSVTSRVYGREHFVPGIREADGIKRIKGCHVGTVPQLEGFVKIRVYPVGDVGSHRDRFAGDIRVILQIPEAYCDLGSEDLENCTKGSFPFTVPGTGISGINLRTDCITESDSGIIKSLDNRDVLLRGCIGIGTNFPPVDNPAALESGRDIKILFANVYRCAGSNFCKAAGSRGCEYHDEGETEKKIFSMHEK